MDEELVIQIEEEDGVNINELLEEHNLEVESGIIYGSEEDIEEFLYDLIDEIGLKKTLYVAESIEGLEEKLQDLIAGDSSLESAYSRINDENEEDIEESENKAASEFEYDEQEVERDFLLDSGISSTTHKIEDMEQFREFVIDKIVIDEDTIESYINSDSNSIQYFEVTLNDMISEFSEEEKADIMREAGRYILYVIMSELPYDIDSVFADIVKEFDVRVIDIPAGFNIEIPNSLFGIDLKIEAINVDEKNKRYSSKDGVLFNKEGTKLLRYPSAKEGEEYTILDEVTEVDDIAFLGAKKLKAIHVDPKNKNLISKDGVLFHKHSASLDLLCYPAGREGVEYTVPQIVSRINQNAFSFVTNLRKVKLFENATNRMIAVFKNEKKITDIDLIPLSLEEAIGCGHVGANIPKEEQEEQYRKHLLILKLSNNFIRK